nr:PREDICTED: LOW QUALITY PROTEIN: uncharacterized protein LOC107398813 [Tribolium castaneum]|eukprot:XP_015839716.1 PREDICTED: LOW QUALITY PROTEIN: uncharacterized protein LOC107398813 [Tribolium castaneum]
MEISSRTLVDWFSFIREVFIFWSVQHSEDLGGEGKTVEIDEAEIGKRKYNRGRYLDGQWVFGGIECETKCFFVAIPDRTSETLLSIIKERILPRTTIISDCWTAYDCLSQEHYYHLIVNHSLNFVDPVHTLKTSKDVGWKCEEKCRGQTAAKIITKATWPKHFSCGLTQIIESVYIISGPRHHSFTPEFPIVKFFLFFLPHFTLGASHLYRLFSVFETVFHSGLWHIFYYTFSVFPTNIPTNNNIPRPFPPR